MAIKFIEMFFAPAVDPEMPTGKRWQDIVPLAGRTTTIPSD
jgi:hypothetical protein